MSGNKESSIIQSSLECTSGAVVSLRGGLAYLRGHVLRVLMAWPVMAGGGYVCGGAPCGDGAPEVVAG